MNAQPEFHKIVRVTMVLDVYVPEAITDVEEIKNFSYAAFKEDVRGGYFKLEYDIKYDLIDLEAEVSPE